MSFPLFSIIRQPRILKPYKHIFLLSHMRANTSLFGHVLGDNSEIEGYYEMHISYYSWKSLIRQKMLYFEAHAPKPKAKYFFDKVLHNDHYVNPSLLKRKDVQTIFSLREPQQTIRSIVKLYEKVNPSHEFCSIEGAVAYYNDRLNKLLEIAKELKGKYLYLDAQSLRDDTDKALLFLTREIGLTVPLSKEYKSQKFTGVGHTGDHSKNIKAGKVLAGKTDYSDLNVDDGLIAESELLYEKVRKEMMDGALSFCIMQ